MLVISWGNFARWCGGKSKHFSTLDKDFPVRLRTARARKGWVQQDLADEMGVSAGSIGNWEVGANEPTPRTLKKLSDVLGVSLDFLAEGISGRAPDGPAPRGGPVPAWAAELVDRLAGTDEPRRRRLLTSFHAVLDALNYTPELSAAGDAPPLEALREAERMAADALALRLGERIRPPAGTGTVKPSKPAKASP